ncbi:MAG: hypothetical protein R3B40_04280 [Polyangiales bacterium]
MIRTPWRALSVAFLSSTALPWLLTLGACAGDFEPGSHLGSLRLLAVRVSEPITHPGEDVLLEALLYDPEGAPRAWGWATCTHPSGSTAQACMEALDEESWVLGTDLDVHHVTIPADLLASVPSSARDAVYVGILVAVCPGSFVDGDTHGVPVACAASDGRRLELDELQVGFKRIRVRAEDRNANPAITSLSWAGRSWPELTVEEAAACDGATYEDCPAALRYTIEVAVTPPETGEDELGAPFHEQVIVQYYATHGRFRDEVRTGDEPETSWVAADTVPGDVVTFYVVVRDDRGGTAFLTRELVVR